MKHPFTAKGDDGKSYTVTREQHIAPSNFGNEGDVEFEYTYKLDDGRVVDRIDEPYKAKIRGTDIILTSPHFI